MKGFSRVALFLWASILLVAAQGVEPQGSCSDGGDFCPQQPEGPTGLPLYVGLQPQQEGWVYDLTFHRDGERHIRVILKQDDERVRVDVQYGEYLRKASIFNWPNDHFPLCDWRYFLISEKDDRLQVLYENTTAFTTDTFGYVLPALESSFTAVKSKVRVNCDPRPLGKMWDTSGVASPNEPHETSQGLPEVTEGNTTMPLQGNESMSSGMNNGSMFVHPMSNESIPALPVSNESLSTVVMNNESMAAFPVNSESLSTILPNNESMAAFPVNNESLFPVVLNNESMAALPVNNDGLSTILPAIEGMAAIPVTNESLSTILFRNESMSTVPASNSSLPSAPGNNGSLFTLGANNVTTSASLANSEGSQILPTNVTLSPSDIHPKVADPAEETAEGRGVSQPPPPEEHTTPPPKTTTADQPRFTFPRGRYDSPDAPDDTTDTQNPKKNGTSVIIVVSVIGGILFCVSCALCLLYKRRSRRSGSFATGEAPGSPETVKLQSAR